MHDEISLILQLCVYAVTFGVFYGTTSQRLKQLERTIESQQEMFEQLCKLSGSIEIANGRISDLKKDVQILKQARQVQNVQKN